MLFFVVSIEYFGSHGLNPAQFPLKIQRTLREVATTF